MSQEIPKQIQDKIMQFQSLQNQLQVIVAQKQQLVFRAKDMENAIEELEKPEKGKIYKIVGPLMIETSLDNSKKDVEEEKDTAHARIKILESQENKMSEKLKELGAELQAMTQSQSMGGVTGG